MDDWLTDSGSEGGGEEGENPLVPGPLQPTGTPTHRQASSDVDSEAVGQEVLSDLLDAPLTEEELERNFDFEVDDCDTESAHSKPAFHQTPEAPGGTDRPSQEPATRGARGNQSPTASLPSTESRPDSSAATRGTILVSSREVAYSQVGSLAHLLLHFRVNLTCEHFLFVVRFFFSFFFFQVVSTLRNKHHLSVLLCPLSHGGFIVSNRMAVERKLQSGGPPPPLPGT